jgi:hypothetical protein
MIEIGLLVLVKKIFKSVFLLFCFYLPLGMCVPLHLNNLECPLPKDDLCQVWSKFAKWFWRRSRKFKSLQTDGQQAIRKPFLSESSSKLKTKLCISGSLAVNKNT